MRDRLNQKEEGKTRGGHPPLLDSRIVATSGMPGKSEHGLMEVAGGAVGGVEVKGGCCVLLLSTNYGS